MYQSARRRRSSARSRRPRSTKDSQHRLRMVLLVVALALAVVGLRYANLRLLDQRLVHIHELPDSVVSAGFSLSSDRELQIDVFGTTQIRQQQGASELVKASLGNVWVIDAATKESVWDMREVSVRRGANGELAYQGTVVLTEGQYVLYCSVQTEAQRSRNESWVNWLDADRETPVSRVDSALDSEGFQVTIVGRGRQLSGSEVVAALEAPIDTVVLAENERSSPSEPTRSRRTNAENRRGVGALVDLTKLEDDEAKFAHFSLSRRTDVRIYALGEGSSGEMYDYGWIVNTANGRTVWEMKYRDTEHAGGDRKNRLVDATISLRRGNYVVYFVTDESHSYDDWNATKPLDEEGWGITVTEAPDPDDRESESVRGDSRWTTVAQLTDIRDDVSRRARFTLDRRTRVRVYALGEGDRNEMYDFAWVEEADSRSTIWEMTYSNSEHAGGASKNRLFDSIGWLPAGDYIVRYRSDDSHSPESWNADPPNDRRKYGVTVYVEGRSR